jgi:FixJ family two-component response regulator
VTTTDAAPRTAWTTSAERELEVLRLLASGNRNRDIARELAKTVWIEELRREASQERLARLAQAESRRRQRRRSWRRLEAILQGSE